MHDAESASSAPEPVEDLLRRVPFFQNLDRVDLARLVGSLEQVRFGAGALVFAEGSEADALYLLEAGKVGVTVTGDDGERSVAVLEAPGYFGELGLLLGRRTASVRALTDIDLWVLPRHRFDRVARERGAVGIAVAASLARLLEERSRAHAGVAVQRPEPEPAAVVPVRAGRPRGWRVAGAVLPVLLPVALWFVAAPAGLSTRAWHVVVIVAGAALGWLFQPVADYTVALAMAAAWGLTGLVPVSLAFAGFAGSTWVLAFGAVGLAAAMARSGLLFRLTVLFLRILPVTHTGQVLALLLGGVLITPVVPSASARIATTAALAHELGQMLGYVGRSRASAALAFAGLVGYTTLSSVFLTGLTTNFFILGLLPPADQARINWVSWFVGAAPVGLVVCALVPVAMLLLFRVERAHTISADAVRRQHRVLGALSGYELVTIAAGGIFVAGLILQPVLHVEGGWIATVALVVVAAGGVLDRTAFRLGMEWGFLVLFGLLIGSGSVFHSVGIDGWISRELTPLLRLAGRPAVVVALLGLAVAACRLVLARVPTNFLLSLALIPVAPRFGLSPWLVGFIVLTVGNTWVVPGLSDFYVLMREGTHGEMFTDREALRMGIVVTVLVLVAITAAVPYWRAIGLISR